MPLPDEQDRDRTTPAGLRFYLEAQEREALGEVNMYYAGQRLGHEPTPSEAMLHFALFGGAADFARRYADVP